ncbi:hypothetical protein L218DRAFT_1080883 [Marasmius fiardii PR-910]|nr:hypothetical protein L218DRAFT_1080883 [Marasmius fiardii PR-910]
MLRYGRRSLVLPLHKRSYSLFLRNPSTAELVATVKPQKPALDETTGRTPDYFPKLGGLPEVIVTGRANSGKSTLFNAVLGRKDLIETSKKAGHTKALNFYRAGNLGRAKLLLVDAPGYGQRGRPEWGALFNDYIKTRRQLRRILITLNVKNGINSFDGQMIQMLCQNIVDDFTVRLTSTVPSTPNNDSGPSSSSTQGSPRRFLVQIQPIFTKADFLPGDQTKAQKVIDDMKFELKQAVDHALQDVLGGGDISVNEISKSMCLSPILTSSVMSPPFGIEEVRKSIVEACGLR